LAMISASLVEKLQTVAASDLSAERDQIFVCVVAQPVSQAMLSDPSQAIQ
jgi:hypothetical protein